MKHNLMTAKHNLMTAQTAKSVQAELNSPEGIKARNERRMIRELNRLNEEIQSAIQRNESDVVFNICKCPEILKPMKKILKDLGYTVSKTTLDETFAEFRVKW